MRRKVNDPFDKVHEVHLTFITFLLLSDGTCGCNLDIRSSQNIISSGFSVVILQIK